MNQPTEIDRVLSRWFDDGPSTMPDRVVDVVAGRIGRQPQRRASRLQRRLKLTPSFKLAIGLAAAFVVATIGWNLLPRQPGIGGGPTPAPTATAAPTPAKSADPACDNGTTGCRGR